MLLSVVKYPGAYIINADLSSVLGENWLSAFLPVKGVANIFIVKFNILLFISLKSHRLNCSQESTIQKLNIVSFLKFADMCSRNISKKQ